MTAGLQIYGYFVLILRVIVPLYLFSKAIEENYVKPAWWILFGVCEPVIALMAYYLVKTKSISIGMGTLLE